ISGAGSQLRSGVGSGLPAASACPGGLFGRGGALRGRAGCRGRPALLSALLRRGLVHTLAAARATFLAAAGHGVDRGPGAALGFSLGGASLLVAFLDVLGLAFLFLGVLGLLSTGHRSALLSGCVVREHLLSPSTRRTGRASALD